MVKTMLITASTVISKAIFRMTGLKAISTGMMMEK